MSVMSRDIWRSSNLKNKAVRCKVCLSVLPDFKTGHQIDNEIEIVDLYQVLCFLLDIPSEEGHEGTWDNIKDMLTISGSMGSPSGSLWHVLTVLCISRFLVRI